MTKNKRCIVCGAIREDAKRDCGKHTYEEYKKVKSKIWNDPCLYNPLIILCPILLLIGFSLILSEAIMVVTLSISIPLLTTILLHNYRQKRKDLPFWGLTDEEEVDRALHDSGK